MSKSILHSLITFKVSLYIFSSSLEYKYLRCHELVLINDVLIPFNWKRVINLYLEKSEADELCHNINDEAYPPELSLTVLHTEYTYDLIVRILLRLI